MRKEYNRKNLSLIYQNEINEENDARSIVLKADYSKTCDIKLVNFPPKNIVLSARIIPQRTFSDVVVERIENENKLANNHIYTAPIFHSLSEIKNQNNICSRIIIKYENSGTYYFGQQKNNFFGKEFDEYNMKFANDVADELFCKNFLVLTDSITENVIKSISIRQQYRFYPYGGFYEYGIHPRGIESCIFQIKEENQKSAIRSWTYSRFTSKFGRDPSQNETMSDGSVFVGVTQLSASHKNNLYDELADGACKITLVNKKNGEEQIYKSSSLLHFSGTDLIEINFIKE